ncbi:MAG: pyridoxal-phosphate dependent enzyme, partial [Desulfobacula sp.]|nr:pyridoxal-phosphate dependent enzyme [Desulfobacula sp.]
MPYDIQHQVLTAEKRIRKYIRKTPLEPSPYLGELGECRVHLKLENAQVTGSFKFRGATNKFLSLDKKERKEQVITASSGNHGAALAHVLELFKSSGIIFLPENASPTKVKALSLPGITLKQFGDDCIKSETLARQTAKKTGQVFISPYNDLDIIGGQGTIGIELLQQTSNIDCVLVPVGGGGLMSGIAGFLKAGDKHIKIIGCQPENSPIMQASILTGKILDMESKPTIADGTAGGIESGSVTFDICREFVDEFIL